MTWWRRQPDPLASIPLNKARLETLCDGVFAVVMTLLALSLAPQLPRHADDAEILASLRQLARPAVAYGLTFMMAGLYWFLHHRLSALQARIDARACALTLVFLLTLTVLPFTMSIFAQSPKSMLGTLAYFGGFWLVSVAFWATWVHARDRGLLRDDLTPEVIQRMSRNTAILPLAISCGLAVAPFSRDLAALSIVVPGVVWMMVERRRRPASEASPAAGTAAARTTSDGPSSSAT